MSLFNDNLQKKTASYMQMQTISGYFNLMIGIGAVAALGYIFVKYVWLAGLFNLNGLRDLINYTK